MSKIAAMCIKVLFASSGTVVPFDIHPGDEAVVVSFVSPDLKPHNVLLFCSDTKVERMGAGSGFWHGQETRGDMIYSVKLLRRGVKCELKTDVKFDVVACEETK